MILEEGEVPEEKKDFKSIFCLPEEMFKVFDQEMRCGICLNVYKDPIELPCYHVFCLECLRRQSTIQKSIETLPRCAECNRDFNMRTLLANKSAQCKNVKVNKLLDVYNAIKYLNDIFDEEEPDLSAAIELNQQRIELFKKRQAELLSNSSDSIMQKSFQDLHLERSASVNSITRETKEFGKRMNQRSISQSMDR